MWKYFGPRLPDTIDYDTEEFNRLNVAKSLSSPGPVRSQPFGESLNERNLEFTEDGQSKLAGRLLHKANVPTPLNPPKPPETLDRRVDIFSDAANPSPSSIQPATMAEMPLKRSASPEQNRHSAKHQKMDVEAAELMPPPPPSAPPTLAPITEVPEVEEEAAKTEQLSPMGDIPPEEQSPESAPEQIDDPDAEPEDLEAKNEAESERQRYLQAEYGNDPVPDAAELPEDDDLPEEPVDRMDLEEPAEPEAEVQEEDNQDVEEPEQPKVRSPSPTPPPVQKQKKPSTTPRTAPVKIVLPPEPEDEDDLPPEEDVVPRKPKSAPAKPTPPKPKKKTVARRPPTPEPSEEIEEDDGELDEENSDDEDSGMNMVDDEVDTDVSDEEPSDGIDLDDSSAEEDRPRRKGQKGKELPPIHQSYEQRNAADIQKLMDKEAQKEKSAKGGAKPKKRRVELVGATVETDPLPSILGRPATPAAPKATATKKPKLDSRLLASLAKLEAATMTRTITWSDLYRTDEQMEEIHPDVVSGFRRTWDDAVCRALNRSFREVKQGKYHDEGVSFEREILELTKPRVFKNTEDPVHMYQQLCWYYKDIDFEIPENFTETCHCIITWSNPRETDTPIFTAPRIRRRIYCRYIGAVANCRNAIRPWQFCLIKANRMVDQIRGQIQEISRERVYNELSPWEGCGKNQFREWLNAWVFAEWNLYFFK